MIEYSAKKQSFPSYLQKCWEFRSLIMSFVRRDLKIKYAQTTVGLLWTLLQPIALATVYFVFFQLILPINTDQPYILVVFSGVIFWNVFSSTLLQSSLAIQQNQELIRKMYFPKALLFFSKAIGALLDGLIGWVLLVILMLIYNQSLPYYFLLSLFFFIPLVFFSLGLSFLVARMAITKRDVLLALPFFVQLSIWFTPVFYSLTFLPEKWAKWIAMYPVNATLDGFRAAFSLNHFSWSSIGIGCVTAVLFLLAGLYIFSKSEEQMMDEL